MLGDKDGHANLRYLLIHECRDGNKLAFDRPRVLTRSISIQHAAESQSQGLGACRLASLYDPLLTAEVDFRYYKRFYLRHDISRPVS